LLGNPLVWWLGMVSVVIALVTWLLQPKLLGHRRHLIAFLLMGYALNFLPFSVIDRPMFLYHYLFAVVISILITCVLLAQLFKWQAKKYDKKAANYTYWLLVIAVILVFAYFLPLSYGWPLSSSDLQQHMWLSTWR
jgi:dolichyl-phosphate-mannose--protein O-mannosyl transferase